MALALAFIKVDLKRRPVQHLEGGIVREVLVRDGQQDARRSAGCATVSRMRVSAVAVKAKAEKETKK
jgi:hypothetical protein